MLPSSDIVPGDVIILGSGDRVPADARLLESYELLVDESSFTGEPEFVSKYVSPGEAGACFCALYAGSVIRQGRCKALVIATGEYSEFGTVLKLMRDQSRPETPLQIAMDHLSKQITVVSVTIISLIVTIGYTFGGYPIREILSIGVSLAVAAIPEGLPVVVTVTLALGIIRMAKHGAIVRHIQSMETMGRVDIMCFDKTGTLSQNNMTLHSVLTVASNRNRMWVAASGKTTDALVEPLIEAGMLCSNVKQGCFGQSTETALWTAANTWFPQIVQSKITKWTRVTRL